MLYTTLIVFHVVLAASLIAIVLVQRGPGATMGAAFGAGASGTVFGSQGSASFLTKTTTWMGIGFFAISLSMAVILARSVGAGAPADDLGVASSIGGAASMEMSEDAATGDDEFLTLPIEGDDVRADDLPAVEDSVVDAAEGAMEDAVDTAEAIESDVEDAVEAVEPPPES